MHDSFWHKQTVDQPLFPALQWSQPENRQLAGKLLIAGGNLHSFAAVAEAYAYATKAGVGVARVLLPDALRSSVGIVLETGEYARSTPSGSFSQQAQAELLSLGEWADAVLLAGDFGRNAETAILLEKFVQAYSGQITITKDALDYFTRAPQKLLQRGGITIVASLAQLQELAKAAHFPTAITFGMDLLRLTESLHAFTELYPIHIVVKQHEQLIVAVNGEVSTTRLAHDLKIWRVQVAARCAVWWLQNPGKAFQALSVAVLVS